METTLDTTSSQLSTELNQLVFGDRNIFIFNPQKKGETVNPAQLAQCLRTLNKIGYSISNVDTMLDWSQSDLNQFKDKFIDLVEMNTKDGMIFRKSFGESEELTDYTIEEWEAIFAQYSVTYGWEAHYLSRFGKDPMRVLDHYVGTFESSITDLSNPSIKSFNVNDNTYLVQLVKDILESKSVLRTQQIKTLEAVPVDVLVQASKTAKIEIKETLIKVMSLLQGVNLDFPLLKTPTDVLRFVLSAYSKDEPIEGQLTKTILKTSKIRIPTSVRKTLLNNLEQIAHKVDPVEGKDLLKAKGTCFLAEDMLTYEMFWKRLDKYLRYEKAEKTRSKFPFYTSAIDLVYEGDRSWTFNGRLAAAKAELDYDKAIRILAERPGFLLRNLIEYLRMVKGVKLPVKKVVKLPVKNRSNKENDVFRNNPFQNALKGLVKDTNAVVTKDTNTVVTKDTNTVVKDASDFLLSSEFVDILNSNLNTKLAWQLLEQLKDPSLLEEKYERTVQGQVIKYTVPFPGVDENLTKVVRKQIMKAIQSNLSDRNKELGKVFVDDDSKKYRLQYSGRSSTELSFAGEFLSPGSELSISEVIKSKGIDNAMLRLGVMWRGLEDHQSVDIDHNVTIDDHDVWYSNPTMKIGNQIVAASSGDITGCGGPNDQFSTELVDIDIAALYDAGYENIYNSMIVYSGYATFGELETYLFFSVIDKKDRTTGNQITMDLAKADYAIRVDPDNTDQTGSYIGVRLDLKKDRICVLNTPVKSSAGMYSNVRTNAVHFEEALKNFDKHLTIHYALKNALGDKYTNNLEDADLVISRKSKEELGVSDTVTVIHPGRQMEEINKLLF